MNQYSSEFFSQHWTNKQERGFSRAFWRAAAQYRRCHAHSRNHNEEQSSTSITIKETKYFDEQWGLKNTTYGSKAEAAWDSGVTGSLANVIGVIDSGIDYKHPDLYLNIWLNPGEVPDGVIDINNDGLITFFDLNDNSNSAFAWDFDNVGDYGYGYVDAGDLFQNDIWIDGFDNENNGYIDDLIGWDFYNNDNDPFDDDGHGTMLQEPLGTFKQSTGDKVNFDIQLTALKFLSPIYIDAIRAIDYFTDAAIRYDSLITNNGTHAISDQ